MSALVWGVDIMESYSPQRVAEGGRKYMLEPNESLDLKSGRDLSSRGEQERARALLLARPPKLIIFVFAVHNVQPSSASKQSNGVRFG